MRRYTADQFAKLGEAQKRDSQLSIASSSIGAPEFGESGRLVRYTFSTPAVGRDMHTVASDAWVLSNFLRNPVFLWAHDDQLPPIGRVIDIGNVGGALKGSVEYAERELNPFADTIYQLVKNRYLNAVSTSWQPLDWSMSRDKARPGGVDFTKVDLLEISQVPIPALPAALAGARSRGVNVRPLHEWAARALDSSVYRAVPRQQLEAIRRATGAGALTSLPRRSAARLRADPADVERRRGRVLEIEAQQRRLDRVALLQARGRTGLNDATEATLATAQKHHERALGHHRSIAKGLAVIDEHVGELRSAHRRMTSTLKSLGVHDNEQLKRFMGALERHIGAADEGIEDAYDSHINCGDAVGRAARCVRSVLEGIPSDTKGSGAVAEEDEDAAREERRRRLRLLQTNSP